MKQELEFCSKCGRLSENIKLDLCPNCLEDERNEFQKIRDYLKSHPRSSAMDIALATNIPINKITRYIKDNSLIINE